MRFRSWLVVVAMSLATAASAQPPVYRAAFVGEFFVSRMNESAQMIGVVTEAGNQRGFAVGGGFEFGLLPLPAGMQSSIAVAISDLGVIVGAVSASSSPEFGGRAAVWRPDNTGGYGVELLGALPGHSVSRATAVNDVGDILGYSSDGQYRYPVLFTAPGGVMDLSFTGIFDPVDVNERRIVVDQSFTVKRLDLETMVAEDLGTPGNGYLATTAAAINESGQVAGVAILTGSDNCDRLAARYSDGAGWEIFSTCGQHNGAVDLNDSGDLVMRLNVAPYVYLEGLGTHRIEDLIVADTGYWYVLNGFGLAINDARQMVVSATNPTTGQSGALLLTPDDATTGVEGDRPTADAALTLLPNEPNPFNPRTTVRYSLAAGGHVRLRILGVDGRLLRTLVDGTMTAGQHAAVWDGRDGTGRDVATGVYLARLELGQDAVTRKLVLAR